MKRDKFIKWFKGCSVVAVVGILLLGVAFHFGWPRYQRWVNERLFVAAEFSRVNDARKWLKLGADIDGKTVCTGWGSIKLSPLEIAIINEDIIMVEFLLNNDADANNADNGSYSPIEIALIRSDNTQVPTILLAHGARLDVKNSDGKTPVDLAGPKCKALFDAHLKKQAENKQ